MENNISEIEDDIKRCELEIQAMELEMLEIEKTYISNEDDKMSEKLVSYRDNEIVRYFEANLISWQLIKYKRLIYAVSLFYDKLNNCSSEKPGIKSKYFIFPQFMFVLLCRPYLRHS